MENREQALLMENRDEAVPGEEEDKKTAKRKKKPAKKIKHKHIRARVSRTYLCRSPQIEQGL